MQGGMITRSSKDPNQLTNGPTDSDGPLTVHCTAYYLKMGQHVYFYIRVKSYGKLYTVNE